MLSPDHIYVASCEWWGGVNDMFALSSSHLMDAYAGESSRCMNDMTCVASGVYACDAE